MSSLSSERFVEEVSRAATTADAVAAAQQAVEDPAIFFYGTLLSALLSYTQQQQHKTSDKSLENWTGVVELLTYKTVADVDAASAGVKALVTEHPLITEKLRVLTLLTLCSQHTMSTHGISVPYARVEQAVGVSGAIEVQKVVLAAVQHRLCVARLNERTTTVRICAYESRCVEDGEVAALQQRVAKWREYAERQLRALP
ncbi:hypothetical protein ABB37_05276 [Leptomonas pyrrhocoris]|uniref:Uncharacterized protein n=1 Tax=Leptomonas pyrrhocoris TaxID=157538 RepID=A0A0N0DUU0_LEPPY|nr:hypothetical protein ABB37_05276 [Leptomonas pyrrhocoris]KPA79438.1 hypothetical protein ABB37_05276 [Leptomonas pyrrhocoris]|eukprot:XP_015657877.1 hypothetical protein ABB37_05276 [Leptomonas pyrrhocoris]